MNGLGRDEIVNKMFAAFCESQTQESLRGLSEVDRRIILDFLAMSNHPDPSPSSLPSPGWTAVERTKHRGLMGFHMYRADAVDAFVAALHAQHADEIARMREDANELAGIRRYLRGEQVGVSTGICESITYGYGELDHNGYWQYPVPPALHALRLRAEQAEAQNQELRDQVAKLLDVASERVTPLSEIRGIRER